MRLGKPGTEARHESLQLLDGENMKRATYWLVCDKGICLYKESAKVQERCIKHGAILTYRWYLAGATRDEARRRVEQDHREAA